MLLTLRNFIDVDAKIAQVIIYDAQEHNVRKMYTFIYK